MKEYAINFIPNEAFLHYFSLENTFWIFPFIISYYIMPVIVELM